MSKGHQAGNTVICLQIHTHKVAHVQRARQQKTRKPTVIAKEAESWGCTLITWKSLSKKKKKRDFSNPGIFQSCTHWIQTSLLLKADLNPGITDQNIPGNIATNQCMFLSPFLPFPTDTLTSGGSRFLPHAMSHLQNHCWRLETWR